MPDQQPGPYQDAVPLTTAEARAVDRFGHLRRHGQFLALYPWMREVGKILTGGKGSGIADVLAVVADVEAYHEGHDIEGDSMARYDDEGRRHVRIKGALRARYGITPDRWKLSVRQLEDAGCVRRILVAVTDEGGRHSSEAFYRLCDDAVALLLHRHDPETVEDAPTGGRYHPLAPGGDTTRRFEYVPGGDTTPWHRGAISPPLPVVLPPDLKPPNGRADDASSKPKRKPKPKPTVTQAREAGLISPAFLAWLNSWPRKEDKPDAAAQWHLAATEHGTEAVADASAAYLADYRREHGTDHQFVPHGGRWLRKNLDAWLPGAPNRAEAEPDPATLPEHRRPFPRWEDNPDYRPATAAKAAEYAAKALAALRRAEGAP